MLINLVRDVPLPPSETDYSNLSVRIRLHNSNIPQRTYSKHGVIINTTGVVSLDENGVLDVWVADSDIYKLELFNIHSGFVYSTRLALETQSA